MPTISLELSINLSIKLSIFIYIFAAVCFYAAGSLLLVLCRCFSAAGCLLLGQVCGLTKTVVAPRLWLSQDCSCTQDVRCPYVAMPPSYEVAPASHV